jgi:hypothetical protein
MKPKTFITVIVIIINALFILSCTNCQQQDTSSTRMGAPGILFLSGAAASPFSSSASSAQENASQKWQQMMTTDIDALQIGKTKEAKGKVLVVSFLPQGMTRSIDDVDEISITFSEPVAPLKKIGRCGRGG